MFIISPFGGVWADRFNRKLLINISDGVVALASLVIAVLLIMGYTHFGILLICTGIRALGQGVQMPAVGAVIPQIVPAEHLTRVNGIHGSVQALCTFASPMLGALLMSLFPLYILFLFDVVTAAIGISILFFFVKVPSLESLAEKADIHYFHDLKEGLRYIRGNEFVLRLLIFQAVFLIFVSPAALLTPLQTVRNFGDDVWRLSAIEIAFSLGMSGGGIIIAAWGGFKNKIVTMTLGCFIFGLTAAGLGLTPFFWLYLGIFVIAGFAMPFFNTPAMVLLQTKVEQEFMGRVFSVFTMVSTSIMPLAMLVYGPLVDAVNINIILVITGVVMMVLSIILVSDKTLRKAGNLQTEPPINS
jgi:DHA3 family macrolide efflux protein-like MFS transporter